MKKWNEIYNREPNYKDVKINYNKLLNERYKEGSYYLMQKTLKEAELAFEQVKKYKQQLFRRKNLYKEAASRPIYRKTIKDLKKGKCRTAYFRIR